MLRLELRQYRYCLRARLNGERAAITEVELSPLTFLDAVAEVAAACPSSAWFLSDEVRERIAAYESAGATDLRVSARCATPEDAERTHAFLRGLCAEKKQP